MVLHSFKVTGTLADEQVPFNHLVIHIIRNCFSMDTLLGFRTIGKLVKHCEWDSELIMQGRDEV